MAQSTATDKRPDQRLGQTYRFADPDMDLFFVAALGWGPAGGLDIGQAFYIASQITDGDADSWVRAFSLRRRHERPGGQLECARAKACRR
ncbi:hypothetical protein [Bradyrhizobium sp. ORS 111]|uniref:hypothetical protein n=1 Tax=Bradyrhizobium sp. ORS 111 TaxID=1685958 RepID=UPI003890AD4C